MCDDQAGTEERRSRKKGNGENDFAKTAFWPLRQESLEGVKKKKHSSESLLQSEDEETRGWME